MYAFAAIAVADYVGKSLPGDWTSDALVPDQDIPVVEDKKRPFVFSLTSSNSPSYLDSFDPKIHWRFIFVVYTIVLSIL